MLSYFTIQNFKSILAMKLDFNYAEKKAPNGYREMKMLPFLQGEGSQRFVPTMALYGANASGKSNIIQAFSTFKNIIADGLTPQSFNPNKLHAEFALTSFELEFYLDGIAYVYFISHDQKKIQTETLSVDDNILYAITPKEQQFIPISSEVYTVTKLKEIFTVECLDEKKNQVKPFLTVLGEGFMGLSDTVSAAFLYISKKMDVYSTVRPSFSSCLDRLSNSTNQEKLEEAFDKIVSILKKLDIDIARMEHSRNNLIDKDYFLSSIPISIPPRPGLFKDYSSHLTPIPQRPCMPYEYSDTIHSYHIDSQGNEVEFDFEEESEGTKRLSCLLGMLLFALEHGNVVIIDELALSLHPLLTSELVKLFKDKRYNTNNAQLIFTTHNTDILDNDLLRISEIGIVNKTIKKGSTIKRVSDFEGVRNVTNFRKQYLHGTYTGIPFPFI